jgi:hypothetical protein
LKGYTLLSYPLPDAIRAWHSTNNHPWCWLPKGIPPWSFIFFNQYKTSVKKFVYPSAVVRMWLPIINTTMGEYPQNDGIKNEKKGLDTCLYFLILFKHFPKPNLIIVCQHL